MAKKTTTIAKMYDDLITALSGVVEKGCIFPGGRPDVKKANLDTMTKYIVAELPVSIEDVAIGNRKFLLNTTGIFYLFTKAKSNMTFNVNALSDLTEEVTDLFPISGKYIAATNPVVLMRGVDEYGYQIVTVTFNVHTH